MDKKFCTVVGGWLYFLALIIISVFITATMIIYPDMWGTLKTQMIVLFIIVDIMSFLFVIYGGCLNFIRFTKDGVFHKDEKFDWETVHITGSIDTGFGSFHYCFYFSDQALNQVAAKYTRKRGLYLQIDKKRLEYFLNIYKKEIHVIETIKITKITKQHRQFLKDIVERVEKHNYEVRLTQEKASQTV